MDQVEFNESKSIIFRSGEVELFSASKVKFVKGKPFISVFDGQGNGIAYVSSQRVFWIDDRRSIGFSIELESFTFSHSKSSLSKPARLSFVCGDSSAFSLEFASGSTEFKTKIESARQRLQQEREIEAKRLEKLEEKKREEARNAAAHVGIAGVMKREREKQSDASSALSLAFSDIESLLTSAKELVGIAERLRKANKSNEENSEYNDYLIKMGIASPVTKNSSGARFHSDLARQVSDFVVAYLKRERAVMIPLTDLFCVFNRARGTEMISPDDLLRSCALLADLDLPIFMNQFKSGVTVVQLASYTSEAATKKILEACEKGPLTELEYAQKERLALALVREQLENAEHLEHIVRDESDDSVSYYLNFFGEEYDKLKTRRPEWKYD